uniref:Uncharacterized protein n=1 Tax=Phocoena sinus TaxID=42100 RepID=A0A8C9BQ91_PHOSS
IVSILSHTQVSSAHMPPYLSLPRQSSVVLVSSVAAYIPLKIGAYSVSKMALLGLSQTLAVELASKNIWVNFLVPGIINTDCSQTVRTKGKVCCDEAVSIRIWINWPEDCAELVSFLCSSDASYITALRLYFTYFFVHISCFSIKC